MMSRSGGKGDFEIRGLHPPASKQMDSARRLIQIQKQFWLDSHQIEWVTGSPSPHKAGGRG